MDAVNKKTGNQSWRPRRTAIPATTTPVKEQQAVVSASKPDSPPEAETQTAPKATRGYAELARIARQAVADKAKALEAKIPKGKKTETVIIDCTSRDEPATNEPVVDEATNELMANEPATNEPVIAMDDATNELAVNEPETHEPVVDEATNELVANEPATNEPVIAMDDATNELAVNEPETHEPVVDEATNELVANEPATNEPVMVMDDATNELAVNEPVVDEATNELVANEPTTNKPVIVMDDATNELAVNEPETHEPVVDEASSELAINESETKEPLKAEDTTNDSWIEEVLGSSETIIDSTCARKSEESLDASKGSVEKSNGKLDSSKGSASGQKSRASLGSSQATTWIQNPDGTLGIPSRRAIQEAFIQASNSNITRGGSDTPVVGVQRSEFSEPHVGIPNRDSERKFKTAQSWSPLLEEVLPQRKKLDVIVSKCAPLVQKENGTFLSYMIIENRCAYSVAFRVYAGANEDSRYHLDPSCGCLAPGKKSEVRITASEDLELIYEKVSSDLFVVEIIPVEANYQFPLTVQWLFDAKRYAVQDKLIIKSYFLKPVFISNASMTSMTHELNPESTVRIATSVSTAQLETLTEEDLGFLKKVLRYFYTDDTVEAGSGNYYVSLISPAVKFVLFSILAYVAVYYGIQLTSN